MRGPGCKTEMAFICLYSFIFLFDFLLSAIPSRAVIGAHPVKILKGRCGDFGHVCGLTSNAGKKKSCKPKESPLVELLT